MLFLWCFGRCHKVRRHKQLVHRLELEAPTTTAEVEQARVKLQEPGCRIILVIVELGITSEYSREISFCLPLTHAAAGAGLTDKESAGKFAACGFWSIQRRD